VAQVVARVAAQPSPVAVTDQRQGDGLEQRALAGAVLAEQHQPRCAQGGRRADVEFDVFDDAHVLDHDPLDEAGGDEVVGGGRRDRGAVLPLLARVEAAL